MRKVVLQNHTTLDMLTEAQGETCPNSTTMLHLQPLL